jgi:hypothetical protein
LNEKANLPRPDRDRPLDEVIEDFARRVCPGGPYGDIDEWSVYDESFRRLVAWAGETGRFFEGLQPLKEGGREHDLSHDPLTGTWLKFTKPSAAGYVVSFASIFAQPMWFARLKASSSPSTPFPFALMNWQDASSGRESSPGRAGRTRPDCPEGEIRMRRLMKSASLPLPILPASTPPMRADKSADRAGSASLPASSQPRACHNRRDLIKPKVFVPGRHAQNSS